MNVSLPYISKFLGRETPQKPFMANLDDFNNKFVDNETAANLYGTYTSMLWDLCSTIDNDGIRFRAKESAYGNPIAIKYDGNFITQDFAKSVIDFIRIENISSQSQILGNRAICEIGPGYGRLADIYAQMTDCRYFFFDIFPSLYISESYFQHLYPDQVAPFQRHRHFDELERAIEGKRFVFLTPNQIELFPSDYFDIAINIDSFSEMKRETVLAHTGNISRITKAGGMSYFRNLSSDMASKVGTTTYSVPQKQDYYLPENWEVLIDRHWPLNPAYQEIISRRLS